jgi:hypothetical protein
MIYLLQVYKMIARKDLFIAIFSDLDYELEEMGWKDDPTSLMNDLLETHFGLTIEDEWQLQQFTSAVIQKKDLNFLKAL